MITRNKLQIKITSHFLKWWFLYAYLIAFTMIALTVLFNRFWQYDIFFFDHGIFDHSLWKASRGFAPFFDHKGILQRHQLSDHFNPTLYLLIPIYWLSNHILTLFVVAVTCIALTGLFLGFFTAKFTKNRLMILAVVMAFTLFIGLQNAILGGFHPEIFGMLLFMIGIYALEEKKYPLMWAMLILALGTKESLAPVIIGVGCLLLWKRELKRGVFAIAFALAYYWSVTRVIIPGIFDMKYFYNADPFSRLEQVIDRLTGPYIKLEVYWTSLATFGVLPILFLGTLPLIGQDYFIRFVMTPGAAAWDLGMHYNIFLTVILGISSAYGVGVLKKWKKYNTKIETFHALLIILVVLGLHYKVHRGPLQLAFNPAFYQNTQNNKFYDDFIADIQEDKIVMTMNHIMPHLTHRKLIFMNKWEYQATQADVILIDLRIGQNANNFWPLTESRTQELVELIKLDPDYELTMFGDAQYRFEKVE